MNWPSKVTLVKMLVSEDLIMSNRWIWVRQEGGKIKMRAKSYRRLYKDVTGVRSLPPEN